MSRPLTEPSIPLGQARQGFSIQQLQRRPVFPGIDQTLGATTQNIYMPLIGNSPNTDDCREGTITPLSLGWVVDLTVPTGGHVTRDPPADGACFSFIGQMGPTGSIWGLSWVYGYGPDYGKLDVSVASLGYELNDRPSGCPSGKIQGYDEAYGPVLDYKYMSTQDQYDATTGYQDLNGNLVWIIGGQAGDPLTDFADAGNPCANNAGVDPLTGFTVWDGGPGWYRFRFQVNGKNASSSDYRTSITQIALIRLDDVGYL